MNEVLRSWKLVFSKRSYLFLAIIIAFFFYVLNVFIANYKSIFSFYQNFGFLEGNKLFLSLSLGFKETIEFHSFVSIIIISILFGMLFSLISYKTRVIGNSDKKLSIFGSIGVFLGALVPGCAACGVGVLSVLGLGVAAVTFLPFDGLEISILAIGILGVTIYRASKDLINCKISKNMFNTDMKGGN
ncbi:hypothetical protein CMI45_01480 [Candidatus Pacearchaeota archaeon]|nr:hypothetical protein [Candidatus Pacearchaeota archaeon]|tara:strand:+ start:2015 stop:2575 length:561 start_codon:yes stop_codon:yes gene_type:complete